MTERIIIGTITLNEPLKDMKSLEWFEDWLYRLGKGINSFLTITDVIFFSEEHINETIQFLTSGKDVTGWNLSGYNELLSPGGNYIRITYDQESEQLLKEFKNGN